MKNLNRANAFDLLNGVKIFFDQINLIFRYRRLGRTN